MRGSIVVWILVSAVGASCLADETQDAFDTLYGNRLRHVRSTGDKQDDVTLAREMVVAARAAAGQPDLLRLICDHAFELASGDRDGFETAIEAMAVLAEHVPSARAEAAARALPVHQRRYSLARSDEKAAAGETLITALLDAAVAGAERQDHAGALIFYRRAQNVAAALRSERLSEIRSAIDRASLLQRLAMRAEKLKAQLKEDPADQDTARQLIMLYLAEMNEPGQARKYTFLLDDEPLKRHVQMAAKSPDTLKAEDLLALGDWYKQLAVEATADVSKIMLLENARAYYEGYLAGQDEGSLASTKAELAIRAIEGQLHELEADDPVAGARRSRDIDLLAAVDLRRDASRLWKRVSTGMVSPPGGAGSKVISFRGLPTGGYDLSARFTPTANARMVWWDLPLDETGKRGVTLFLYFNAPEYRHGLAYVSSMRVRDPDNPTRFAGNLLGGKPVRLDVKVRKNADRVAIAVRVNGQFGTQWGGRITELRPRYLDADERLGGFKVTFYGTDTGGAVHAVKLKTAGDSEFKQPSS